MTTDEALVLVLVGATALALWAGAVLLVPWCVRSLVRYRLWTIRDHLYDDMRTGVLRKSEIATEALESIERSIATTADITPSIMLLSVFAKDSVRQHRVARDSAMEELPADEAERLRTYERDVGKALAIQLLAGSPAGWLTTLFVVPAVVVASILFHRPKHPIRYFRRQATLFSEEETVIAHVRESDTDKQLSAHAG